MKLKIDTSKFEHDPSTSIYNHNYYNLIKPKHGIDSLYAETIIYEEFIESSDFYRFYLITNKEERVFLGSSNNSFSDDVIEIDFRFYYA